MVACDFPLASLFSSLYLSIVTTTSKRAYTYVSVDVTTLIALTMTLIMTVASSGHATAFHIASMPDRKLSFVSYYWRLDRSECVDIASIFLFVKLHARCILIVFHNASYLAEYDGTTSSGGYLLLKLAIVTNSRSVIFISLFIASNNMLMSDIID